MSQALKGIVDNFLGSKRIAVVGISRDPKDFSRVILDEFEKRGYQVVPVNPKLEEIEGKTCYGRVQDIAPAVDGVLVMTPPDVTDQVVRDCAEAGIRRVWMHRGRGKGAVSQEAIEFCQAHDIQVVPGYCPFMFLPDAMFLHRLHGFFMKLKGNHPH